MAGKLDVYCDFDANGANGRICKSVAVERIQHGRNKAASLGGPGGGVRLQHQGVRLQIQHTQVRIQRFGPQGAQAAVNMIEMPGVVQQLAQVIGAIHNPAQRLWWWGAIHNNSSHEGVLV